ncbi:extensin-like [Homarus americanus]|uniref:extensin-like n=1 Tax=Homarus americanus TaxID=6706 RepID=UPI001C4615AA|nr:extensin-like [Homarus americanus]
MCPPHLPALTQHVPPTPASPPAARASITCQHSQHVPPTPDSPPLTSTTYTRQPPRMCRHLPALPQHKHPHLSASQQQPTPDSDPLTWRATCRPSRTRATHTCSPPTTCATHTCQHSRSTCHPHLPALPQYVPPPPCPPSLQHVPPTPASLHKRQPHTCQPLTIPATHTCQPRDMCHLHLPALPQHVPPTPASPPCNTCHPHLPAFLPQHVPATPASPPATRASDTCQPYGNMCQPHLQPPQHVPATM